MMNTKNVGYILAAVGHQDSNPQETKVTITGPSTDDFNRESLLQPWMVAVYLEAGRNGIFADDLLYPCIYSYCVQKYFYNNILKVQSMDIVSKLLFFMQDSNKTLEQCIRDHETGELYATLKISSTQQNSKGILADAKIQVPQTHHSYEHNYHIKPSNLDENGVTSHSAYIQLCMDTAELAMIKKYFPKFNYGEATLLIHQMNCQQHAATVCGEIVTVTVHQDNTCYGLNFQVVKRNSDVAFKMEINYFEPELNKKKGHISHSWTWRTLKKVVATPIHFGKGDVTISSLSFDDFQPKSGNVSLWKIGKLGEIGRVSLINTMLPGFPEFLKKFEILLFLVPCYYQISEEFYTLAKFGKLQPLSSKVELVKVGSSSFDVLSEFVYNERYILKIYSKAVLVSRLTRKPSLELRKNIQEYFGDLKCSTLPEYQQKFDLPFSYHSFKTEIFPSDIDSNMHVNHIVYLKACCDAACVATNEGKYQYFKTPFEEYCPRIVSVLYSGESHLGDSWVVCSWEKPMCNDTLCFIIMNSDISIFYATIQYHLCSGVDFRTSRL